MKKWIPLLICLAALSGYAQEEAPANVREDAFLAQKEIEVWRTDKANDSRVKIYSCQAVQIRPQWFLTAAHCVYTACHGSLPCTVQITLAQGELSEQVRVYHSTASPRVFIYEGFFPGQNRISSVDVALIKLDPSTADYSYSAPDKDGVWQTISPQQFNRLLAQSPETKAQRQASSVRLISAANLSNAQLLPTIAVPRLTQGVLTYLVSPSKEVFFVQELQHFISPGFGVRQGNSGGGVFTAQGDLVGIVSSLVYATDGSVSFRDESGKKYTLKNARDLFFFTGFNGSTLNFIRTHESSLRTVGADNGFTKPTDKQFSDIVKAVRNLPVQLE